MVTHEQNEILTRTGPGTLMGDFFRRYWLPALHRWELPEPDCAPVRVKLLGEQLIASATRRALGLIDEFCAHRGVSLWFGRNEECGLRCPYHGWKYDVTGQCVDLPSEGDERPDAIAHQAEVVPVHRARRRDLDLHGPAGAQARAACARVGERAARAALRLQASAGVQLPAGARRRHRFVARDFPAFAAR